MGFFDNIANAVSTAASHVASTTTPPRGAPGAGQGVASVIRPSIPTGPRPSIPARPGPSVPATRPPMGQPTPQTRTSKYQPAPSGGRGPVITRPVLNRGSDVITPKKDMVILTDQMRRGAPAPPPPPRGGPTGPMPPVPPAPVPVPPVQPVPSPVPVPAPPPPPVPMPPPPPQPMPGPGPGPVPGPPPPPSSDGGWCDPAVPQAQMTAMAGFIQGYREAAFGFPFAVDPNGKDPFTQGYVGGYMQVEQDYYQAMAIAQQQAAEQAYLEQQAAYEQQMAEEAYLEEQAYGDQGYTGMGCLPGNSLHGDGGSVKT